MNVSRRWLEAFLQRPLPLRDLVERLAMLGAPVDAVTPLHGALAEIVVGLVEEVRPHPNADRLLLCTVNVGGGERRTVVTGAPNVEPGRKYPFAGAGVTLPGGLKLERRKLRGEVSEGMLCSSRELELGSEHEGIMLLDTEAPPGTPLPEALGLSDDRLTLDVAPVRADLLGHKGVARELAACYKVPFRLPPIPVDGRTSGTADSAGLPAFRRTAEPAATGGFTVAIASGAHCRRFTAAVVEGVSVAPSPAWLARRLEAVGVRAINNLVDVTNYVMYELGQPLHAYDAARLRGGRIEARLARPGETLVTLDGVRRALEPSLTVIADGEGAVGVAGVMGGRDSEVSAGTTTVLLECAWFDPKATRSSRRVFGLATEASQRFERGTDVWGVPDALRRAIQVLLAVAGGRLLDAPLDLWPQPANPPRIFLRLRRVAQVLGVELPLHVIEQSLVAVGATVLAKPEQDRLAVEVPGWRPDLTSEIDLIEEIARIYGYDRFPDQLRPFRPGNQTDAPSEVAARRVRAGLVAEGLYEGVTLPLGPDDAPDAVPVINPISTGHGYLRRTLLAGLVREVEANWANQVRDVRLFEIGTVFARDGTGPAPGEELHVAGVVSGGRAPAHWSDLPGTRDLDPWDLKGLFERAVSLAVPEARVQVDSTGWIAVRPDGRVAGSARPLAADAPAWAAPVLGFELELDPAPRPAPRYSTLPVLPAALRDLALLVPPAVNAAQIEEVMRSVGGAVLEAVEVIDQYRGPGLPPDRRSLAFRLTFRGRDRTLRDAEVDAAIGRICAALERSLDVVLRTA